MLCHGRQDCLDDSAVIQLLAQIQARCQPGTLSLHRITTSRATGVNYLERESRQAMLPADSVEVDGASALQAWRPSVTIITMNVDGLRNRNNGARMNAILAMLLAKGPDVLMFQEVVDEMYDVLEQRLGSREWQIKRKCDPEMLYYNMTAVRRPTDAATRYKRLPAPSILTRGDIY